MGRKAAPIFDAVSGIAGAALQPFRDTRPLLQKTVYAALTPTTRNVYAQVASATCAKGMPDRYTAGLCANACFYWP
ncbi:protein of unknown function [Pseudomonas inefficax]|uniref:Uncharacterized protein n=1 Tax=Pseudomonas inefficax TaxID=2078786 RepID=A0AAQ1SRK7_9PSED|nr:protein of unknown function [Pseudomonas inefficax]